MDTVVFNIGLNKTGTFALSRWLQAAFGVRAIHDAQGNNARVAQWCDSSCPDSIFRPGTVYLDGFALIANWHRFYLLNPDWKFLVTHRDIEQRITSAMIHVLSNRVQGSPLGDWLSLNTDFMHQEHRRHYQAIRKFMEQTPERFHWLEAGQWNGRALAEFLGTSWDGSPPPRINTGRDRLRQLSQVYH